MDPTMSISKGVFVMKGSFQKRKRKTNQNLPLFERCFDIEPWYATFKENWKNIEQNLQNLNLKTYNNVLSDMVTYIQECYEGIETETFENLVPSATLLTGVNQPDHLLQFSALMDKIRCEATPHIATVHSQDAPSIRHLVECTVFQLVNDDEDNMDISCDADDSMESPIKKGRVKKSQCTMMTLRDWYTNKYSLQNINDVSPRKRQKLMSRSKPLVVIIPDFESFSCEVLQDFVTIISSYTSSLPVILVFGVATSVSALHKSFPYHVSSKLLIKVFQSHSSTSYLNQVLEEVFLTPECPFHLSGRAFELFTDVFLFYDFSVTGFTTSIKYCMMDHYYGDNIKSLCCDKRHISLALSHLTRDDLERIRRLPSFRPHVESQDCRTRISLLEDDEYLRKHMEKCLSDFHEYLYNFHAALKVFFIFVRDLPRNLLGKQIREFYIKCTSDNLTDTNEFKECIQLLRFQSKSQFVEKITSCLKYINTVLQPGLTVKSLVMSPLKNSPLKANKRVTINEKKEHIGMASMNVELTIFLNQVKNARLHSNARTARDEYDSEPENLPVMNRLSLKENLLKVAKEERTQSEFEMVRSSLIDYLVQIFTQHLVPLSRRPFHEIFIFDDIASVKKQIIGAPRGAIHTALNNPVAYLQCSCCELPTAGSVSATLPDTSIAYKLHLECGKLINLYDWLQAFAAVVDSSDDEERRDIPVNIQARFTRAVAELQLLGFIKPSKRKTDHVTRLTW